MSGRLLCLLLVSCVCHIATADVFRFNHEALPYGSVRARPGIMYALEDSPAGTQPAFIQHALQFTIENSAGAEPMNNFVEVVILAGGSFDFRQDLGIQDGDSGEIIYCCSTAYLNQPGCTESGRLIVNPAVDVWRAKYVFNKDKDAGSPAEIEDQDLKYYHVNKTGRHTLIVSNCDVVEGVFVTGNTIWLNPYGYLPGQLYRYLPFYAYMSLIYIGVACVWFLFNAVYWSEVVMLQNAISAVLTLCLVEMATWYFDYVNYNHTGERHVGPFVVGILSSVVRRSVSRMLVVSVALGYGVVRPTLGEDRNKIFLLGGLYFMFGTILELLVHYGQTNDLRHTWKLMFTLPVAGLDAYAYWWIFISLYQLMAALQSRKQLLKLALYQRFFGVLTLSLILALLFACYQVWFMTTNEIKNHWDEYWLLENGFWQILYTVILFSIMLLWRPNKDSRQYAYAQLETMDQDDEMDELDELDGGDTDKDREAVFEVGDSDEEADDKGGV